MQSCGAGFQPAHVVVDWWLRPSGPPPASQRRAISVVIRVGIGMTVTTLITRTAAYQQTGKDAHDAVAVECPVPICAEGDAWPGDPSGTNTDPAHPGERCFSCPVTVSGGVGDHAAAVAAPA